MRSAAVAYDTVWKGRCLTTMMMMSGSPCPSRSQAEDEMEEGRERREGNASGIWVHGRVHRSELCPWMTSMGDHFKFFQSPYLPLLCCPQIFRVSRDDRTKTERRVSVSEIIIFEAATISGLPRLSASTTPQWRALEACGGSLV